MVNVRISRRYLIICIENHYVDDNKKINIEKSIMLLSLSLSPRSSITLPSGSDAKTLQSQIVRSISYEAIFVADILRKNETIVICLPRKIRTKKIGSREVVEKMQRSYFYV